jgi:hypothetical protein
MVSGETIAIEPHAVCLKVSCVHIMLEIKSVVIHFQGKAFDHCLHISLQMLGVGQLIPDLKLGGVNHIGKNCVCARRHIAQGDFPATGRGGSHF